MVQIKKRIAVSGPDGEEKCILSKNDFIQAVPRIGENVEVIDDIWARVFDVWYGYGNQLMIVQMTDIKRPLEYSNKIISELEENGFIKEPIGDEIK